MKVYGLTLEEYNDIVGSAIKCAICPDYFDAKPRGSKHVDHCHATGKVRGVLCNKCNMSLGLMRDSPALLRAAANYLETNG